MCMYNTTAKSNKKAIRKTIPAESPFTQKTYNTGDNLLYFILNLEMFRSFSSRGVFFLIAGKMYRIKYNPYPISNGFN